jgi:acyl-CoA thioester hydrolase
MRGRGDAMNQGTAPVEHTGLDVVVKPEWIDFNGHMNIAYYVAAFDLATDNLFRIVTPDIWDGDVFLGGFYAVEMHITYERELYEGQPLRITTQMLGVDDKRLHFFHRMYHATEGYLAATNELLFLCVSRETRRAAAMAGHHFEAWESLVRRHALMPKPHQAGRVMSVKARKPGT